MRYLCTADWHLPPRAGTPGWGGIPECGDDVWAALGELMKLAEQLDAVVLLAGDVWDDGHRVTVEQLQRLNNTITRPTRYILGNHDAGQDWLQFLTHTLALAAPNQPVLPDRYLYVVGYNYADDFDPVAWHNPEQLPEVSIALYHQHWREWHKRGRVSLRDLPPYAVSVCGDVHVTACLRDDTSPTDRYWVSPGPLVPQDVSETDYGNVYLVETRSPLAMMTLAGSVDTAPPILCEPPKKLVLPNRRAYLRVPVAPDPEEALGRAAVAALDSQLNGKPLPAVVYEGAERYPGFRETARKAATQCHYLVAFRTLPPPAADPEALTDIRVRHGNLLPDVIGTWPTLRDGDRALARRLADPRGDLTDILARARPTDSLEATETEHATVITSPQHTPSCGPTVGPGGADGGALGPQRLG